MHHARLIIAPDSTELVLPEYVRQAGMDVTHYQTDTFTIDDARTLKVAASIRPLERPLRSFVIIATSLTHEAQNALLKLFEDPPPSSEFWVVVPRAEVLLATVRSRLQHDTSYKVVGNEVFDAFVQQSYADRMAAIAENIKSKNTSWIDAMHAGIVNYSGTQSASVASTLVFIDTNLKRRGGSKKMLLETLAVTLPIGRA